MIVGDTRMVNGTLTGAVPRAATVAEPVVLAGLRASGTCTPHHTGWTCPFGTASVRAKG